MQLTLLNDSGKFDGLDDTITHVFAETASKLNALFDLSQLDVTFSPFTEGDDNGTRIRAADLLLGKKTRFLAYLVAIFHHCFR
ncbi:hypothetical protein [Aeromonas allosaccharophila]|uniref:hypothetical protein n=1 Tax=Aeromonas allosaccharophila TaxID=656 RepID=UPI003D22307F